MNSQNENRLLRLEGIQEEIGEIRERLEKDWAAAEREIRTQQTLRDQSDATLLKVRAENQIVTAQLKSLESQLDTTKNENNRTQQLLSIAYAQIHELKANGQQRLTDALNTVKELKAREDHYHSKLGQADAVIQNKTAQIALLTQRVRDLEARIEDQLQQFQRQISGEKQEFRQIASVIQASAMEAVANIPLHLMMTTLNQTLDRLTEISNEKKVPVPIKQSIVEVAQNLKTNLGDMQVAMQRATAALNQESDRVSLLEAVSLDEAAIRQRIATNAGPTQ